jgi:hypothetical protein
VKVCRLNRFHIFGFVFVQQLRVLAQIPVRIFISPSPSAHLTTSGPSRDLDRAYEKHTCFCYYHRHQLTIQQCEELDVAGYADSSTGETPIPNTSTKPTSGFIPPPPRQSSHSEIQIYLLLRHSEGEISNSTPNTEEGGLDISVDINQDIETVPAQLSDENEDNQFFAQDQVYTPRHATSTPADTSARTSSLNLSNGSSSLVLCDPTPLAELVGWGRNTALLFDPSRDKFAQNKVSNTKSNESDDDHRDYVCYHPLNIPVPPSINLERIMMIACSHRHVIVLTHNGSLYSCGDNTEGALGLGDTFSRQRLTLLLWPIDQSTTAASASPAPQRVDESVENASTVEAGSEQGLGQGQGTGPPVNLLDKQLNQGNSFKRIVSVAVGSSDIGSHSMAIDEEGALYGWGTPCATGHGKIQPVLSPLLVNMPLPLLPAQGDQLAQGLQTTPPTPRALATEKRMKVKAVACGGGFTVAILSSGQVASWGTWAHGRLGLGVAPPSELNRGAGARRNKDKKKVVRYQLKPKLIPRLGNAVKVLPSLVSHIL